MEYLYHNSISPKVVRNYISFIASQAKFYSMQHQDITHPAVSRYLRSISIHSRFQPTPRGIFDLKTLYAISMSCDHLSDPILFRATFLCAFYAFLRMSNVAPHSTARFDPDKHFLKQDVIFAPPGVHLIIKWTKTLQDNKFHHMVQLSTIENMFLCPVRALKALLRSSKHPPTYPLFATHTPPFNHILDSHIRQALKTILSIRNISHTGHGFHTFRRSGATLALEHSIPHQNIMSHGLCQSSGVWTYLQNASHSPSIIPSTFASVIPSLL